jgi:hypothetical protein
MSNTHLSTNLDKIIQLISIEQIMGLMKQMKTGVDITSTTTNIEVNTNNSDKQEQIQVPKFECVLPDKMNDQLERINNTLLLIVDKISAIESEIQTLKECKQRSKSDADSEFNEEHIVLKIEEKDIYVKTVVDNLTLDDESVASEADASVEEDPDVSEASEEVDASVEEDPDVNLEVVEAEEEVEAEEDPVVNLEAVVVVNLEDEEVASVAEDDSEKEISDESEEEEEADASEADEDTVVNLDVKEEQPVAAVEEEEEEVFEIEIDDITYYATHEENGILYEVDKDGEVGKKVGIIKDGEPIFS